MYISLKREWLMLTNVIPCIVLSCCRSQFSWFYCLLSKSINFDCSNCDFVLCPETHSYTKHKTNINEHQSIENIPTFNGFCALYSKYSTQIAYFFYAILYKYTHTFGYRRLLDIVALKWIRDERDAI